MDPCCPCSAGVAGQEQWVAVAGHRRLVQLLCCAMSLPGQTSSPNAISKYRVDGEARATVWGAMIKVFNCLLGYYLKNYDMVQNPYLFRDRCDHTTAHSFIRLIPELHLMGPPAQSGAASPSNSSPAR